MSRTIKAREATPAFHRHAHQFPAIDTQTALKSSRVAYSESSTSSSTQGLNENSTARNNTDTDGQSLQSFGTKNSITIKQSSTSDRGYDYAQHDTKTFTTTRPLGIVSAAQNPTPDR